MPYKIAVYCITKNEEAFVDRMMESILDADEIVICDTGSTDGTIDKLKEWEQKLPGKFKWTQMCITPWRFDMARNFSLAMVSKDAEIAICLDLDEVMSPGWREKLEATWTVDTTRYHYTYVWNWKNGLPETSFYADKIHKRSNYRWHHPVHEVLHPYLIEEVHTYANQDTGLQIHHHADNTKSRGQYLRLLELSTQEDPHCDRNSFYLGREYFFYYMYDKALVELARHRSLPRQVWTAERAASHRLSGTCYMILKNLDAALAEYIAASQIAPEMRESWTALAQCHHNRGEWQECYDACQKAMMITFIPATYIVDHESYGAIGHDLLAVSAWNLGKREEALHHAKIAVSKSPTDARLHANVLYFIDEMKKDA